MLNIGIETFTTASECDNMQLKAVLLSPCYYPVQFKWDISFSVVGSSFSSSQRQEALNYFQTYSTYSSVTDISIPSQYFTRNSVMDVVLSAQTSTGIGLTKVSTRITVKANLPTVRFTERPDSTVGYSSDSPTIIAFEVINKMCSDGSRLLQSSPIIPVIVDFKLYSGPSSSLITDRNSNEIQIEQGLSNLYTKYQTINANFSQGFKYNTFYKLVITVTETITNISMSDSLSFSFQKSPITAVIDSLGGIVNTLKDLTLNGGNSTIPLPEGDTIDYTWKCESAISFVNGTTCICPISISSNLRNKQLTIKQSKLQNLCLYTYSLAVIATSVTGNKRTSIAKTAFVAYKASILSIFSKIVQGHMFNVKDMYFSTQITSAGPDSNINFNWSLVQVESLVPSGDPIYSQRNTFIGNFLKIQGTNTSSLVVKNDTTIPEKYQPEYLTSMTQRILGVDAKTMIEKTFYTYAVTVNYPIKSFFRISYLSSSAATSDKETLKSFQNLE